MLASLALAVALWPAQVIKNCPPPNNATIVGVAYNNKNEFLYCEWFSQTGEKKSRVSYVNGSEIFAVKDLDVSISLFIPDVTQIDYRTGEQRTANIYNQQVLLQYREEKNEKIEERSLPISKVDVLDAGFNDFVQSNWDKLVAGDALSVRFGSIAHQKTLPLLISKKTVSDCENVINKTSSQRDFCFTVEIDNVVLRMLIGNIKLSYDPRHRLQEFNGAVNIQDNKAKSQSAIIHYYYREDYIAASDMK